MAHATKLWIKFILLQTADFVCDVRNVTASPFLAEQLKTLVYTVFLVDCVGSYTLIDIHSNPSLEPISTVE
jgi:hypothetical protein